MRVVLDAAQAEARSMQDEYVSTEHLLLGLLSEPGTIDIGRSAQAARRHARDACSKRSRRFAETSA